MVTAEQLQARFPDDLGNTSVDLLDQAIDEAQVWLGNQTAWGDAYGTALKYAAAYLAVGGSATGISSATAGPVSVSYEPGGKGAGFLRMLQELRDQRLPEAPAFGVSRLTCEGPLYG